MFALQLYDEEHNLAPDAPEQLCLWLSKLNSLENSLEFDFYWQMQIQH